MRSDGCAGLSAQHHTTMFNILRILPLMMMGGADFLTSMRGQASGKTPAPAPAVRAQPFNSTKQKGNGTKKTAGHNTHSADKNDNGITTHARRRPHKDEGVTSDLMIAANREKCQVQSLNSLTKKLTITRAALTAAEKNKAETKLNYTLNPDNTNVLFSLNDYTKQVLKLTPQVAELDQQVNDAKTKYERAVAEHQEEQVRRQEASDAKQDATAAQVEKKIKRAQPPPTITMQNITAPNITAPPPLPVLVETGEIRGHKRRAPSPAADADQPPKKIAAQVRIPEKIAAVPPPTWFKVAAVPFTLLANTANATGTAMSLVGRGFGVVAG